MRAILTLSAEPEPEAAQIVEERLNAFNDAHVGYADRAPLTVIARDAEGGAVPGGPILGGIIAHTSLGLLFVDLVYLPDTLRGQDLGSRMMAMVEQEARRRGCRAGVVDTISFQAPGFYQRWGWEVFGEVPCDPPGTSRVFLRKSFV
jgi:GNAT superfamily N-acetyltransferase